jgi:hypothetical protein
MNVVGVRSQPRATMACSMPHAASRSPSLWEAVCMGVPGVGLGLSAAFWASGRVRRTWVQTRMKGALRPRGATPPPSPPPPRAPGPAAQPHPQCAAIAVLKDAVEGARPALAIAL